MGESVPSPTSRQRRSPRFKDPQMSPQKPGHDVVDRVTVKHRGSASSRRSISSPPYRVRHSSRDSESQSGSDEEDIIYRTPDGKTHKKLYGSGASYMNDREEAEKLLRDSSVHSKVQSPKASRSPQCKPCTVKKDTANSVWTFAGIVAVVLSIAVLMILVIKIDPQVSKKTRPVKTLGEINDDIHRDLDKLRSETKQDKRFWGEVYLGLTSLTEESPRQPSVMLLAVPEDAQRTAVCLAHQISDIVYHAFQDSERPVKHDTRSHLHLRFDEHKLVLDEQLSKLASTHAAVLYNLEQMPANTASLLHGYCDNDNAPYKRSVLLLLLELGVHHMSVTPNLLDIAVEQRLHELWRLDMEHDHIPGLVSRVTSQVLLVKPESQMVLDSLCPI